MTYCQVNWIIEISSNSDLKYVYLFSSIAFLIMIIGCINYMNLATARAVKRTKEVGIRKTIGARRVQLIKQFLGESLFLTFLAVMVSLLLVVMIIPHFGSFVNRAIDFELLKHWKNILGLLGLFAGVGLLSGSYSAFLLSSFQPVNALKNTNKMHNFRNPLKLQNILVVFQFCVSVILIVSAIVIQKQLYYIKYRDVGYRRDNIVTVRLWDDSFNNIYQTEQKLGTILTLFSVIAIIIASLGLFGLISFVAERKTREVGIRKVLGASVSAIIKLIVNEFLLLVLISNLIAAPIAYYLMNQWLQSFAYRIDLGFSIFFLSGMASLFIAVITVSYQSIKAATLNPVESLRYE